MTVLPVLHWPDPLLTQPSLPAAVDDGTLTLARDMLDTMYAAQGRGLAAAQVARLTRLFVMDATWKTGPGTPERASSSASPTADPRSRTRRSVM